MKSCMASKIKANYLRTTKDAEGNTVFQRKRAEKKRNLTLLYPFPIFSINTFSPFFVCHPRLPPPPPWPPVRYGLALLLSITPYESRRRCGGEWSGVRLSKEEKISTEKAARDRLCRRQLQWPNSDLEFSVGPHFLNRSETKLILIISA